MPSFSRNKICGFGHAPWQGQRGLGRAAVTLQIINYYYLGYIYNNNKVKVVIISGTNLSLKIINHNITNRRQEADYHSQVN